MAYDSKQIANIPYLLKFVSITMKTPESEQMIELLEESHDEIVRLRNKIVVLEEWISLIDESEHT